MSISKYVAIGKVNFIDRFNYIGDVVSSSVFNAVMVFIFTNLWIMVFGDAALISGFTLVMMVWYVVMTQSIYSSHGYSWKIMSEDIKSGNIANVLIKPYNYLLYQYALVVGNGVFKFFSTFLLSGIIVFLMVGGITISVVSLPLILFSVFLGITLQTFAMIIIGILAFWIEENRGVYMMYSKLVLIIGGTLIPLDFMPAWVGRISAWLPFSAVTYYPAKLFVDFSWASALHVILLQLGWIIFMVIIGIVLFRYGAKKVSVNGG